MQAVLRITKEEGWHALTMRKIADLIRYSPPMIYEVFKNKEAIAAAIVADGHQLLYRHLSTAAVGLADPQKRLMALLKALREFAWEYPAYYEAMYGLANVTRSRRMHAGSGGDYAGASVGLVGDALLQATQPNIMLALPPLKAARAVLAAAHGVIALHLSAQIGEEIEANELYDCVIKGLLAGWGLSIQHAPDLT